MEWKNDHRCDGAQNGLESELCPKYARVFINILNN
jgi:hypothetical protein